MEQEQVEEVLKMLFLPIFEALNFDTSGICALLNTIFQLNRTRDFQF